MKKLVITAKLMDENLVIDEWSATHDVQQPQGNTKMLLQRIRTIVRRELIARSIIAPEPEDAVRKR